MRKAFIAMLVVAVVLVCSLPVFAADSPTFEVDSVTAHPGDQINVNISVKNNPGIASIKLKVAYSEALTLTAVTYNQSIGGMFMEPEHLTNPVTLNWFNGESNSNGDWVFATLTFTVSDAAALGDHPITVTYEADNVYNIAEENLNFDITNGGVKVECAHASKTEVKAVAPGCETAGNNLYFTCDACGQAFKADGTTETTADAEIIPATGHDWADATCTEPETCKSCGAKQGQANGHDWQDATCTKPKTCAVCGDTDGDPLGHHFEDGTCTVCGAQEGLLGDVNDDGEVDVMDANLVIAYYYGNVDFTDLQVLVADVNGDEEVDVMDANLIIAYYYGNIEKFPAEG